jgi:chromosome segregation protein
MTEIGLYEPRFVATDINSNDQLIIGTARWFEINWIPCSSYRDPFGMRLKQIRLAGFKSFVEPTKIPFPTDMTAIVGPNGCGKSNVIDAVRWVLGESSARNLRGDAMTDVIFNGSTRRAPVSKASVELTFDNQSGRMQGEFGNYSEVAVRREVTRDGQNLYYLNGSKCRKRDITDLFLGTGLGPRSYAIIEQGMISRLIESKPQELRVFIDEAAGVSKYKERRRETESRIHNTQENLLRLQDIESELSQQVEKLKFQAKAASQFRTLRDEQRSLKDLDRLCQVYRLDGDIDVVTDKVKSQEERLALVLAQQAELENNQLLLRHREEEIQERLEAATRNYFENTSELAKLEQQRQHLRQSEQQLGERRIQLEDKLALTQADLSQQQQSLEQLQEQHDVQVEAGVMAEQRFEELEASFEAAQQSQEHQEQQLKAQLELERQHQQQQQQIIQSIRNIQQMRERLERALAQQREQLSALGSIDNTELEIFEAELGELESAVEAASEQQLTAGFELQERQQVLHESQEQFAQLCQQHAATKARVDSITDVVAALSVGVHADAPLSQALKVAPGWELAVEKVLGDWLHAELCDERSETKSYAIFTAFNAPDVPQADAYLSSKVSGAPLQFLTRNVFIAQTLDEAFERLDALEVGQSIITPQGEWIGPNWQHLQPPEQQQSLLFLDAQLHELREQSHRLDEQVEQSRQHVAAHQERERSAQEQLRQINASLQGTQRRLQEQQGAYALAKQKQSQRMLAREQIQLQADEVQRNYEQDLQQEAILEAQMLELEGHGEALSLESQRLQSLSDTGQQRLNELNAQLKSAGHQVHQRQLETQQTAALVAQTQQSLSRELRQLDELKQSIGTLPNVSEQTDQLQLLEEQVELFIHQQLEAESLKIQFEAQRAEIHEDQLKLSAQSKSLAQQFQEVQHNAQSQQLREQELLTRRALLIEQMIVDGESLKTLEARLPEPDLNFDYGSALQTLDTRIKRLGAVNLAAEAEYEQQSERLTTLSAQIEDLQQALGTLQSAIAKIDRETRSKFRETFDKVNEDLQQLFPQVFGGGVAWLELVGDDLLDTGVTIMARPPGKKNSTISLLSGGEKALTALALVFAIFRLNPAPFCMLDEVDAPLDEVNVGRFADLVERMSDTVQFIFISHNKVTMEKASQLAGVTMHEPGVSRLVAVDIAQAVAMVE